MLDGLGSCCSSGAVDECGVCDGDGASCSVQLQLLVRLPNNTNLAATAWRDVLQGMLQAAMPGSKAASGTQLQVQTIRAEWLPAATAATRLVPTRRMLEGHTGPDEPSAPAAHSHDYQHAQLLRDDHGQPPDHCRPPDLTARAGNTCSKDGAQMVRTAAAPCGGSVAAAGSRHLLQIVSNSTSDWQTATIEVLLTPVVPNSLAVTVAGSTAGAKGAGILGLGYTLVASLQQQAGASQGAAAVDVGLELQHVVLAQKLGVCGNGLCEVGERALTNSAGEAIQPALVPCAQVATLLASGWCALGSC